MPRHRPGYTKEFRARVVELALTGRTHASLEQEFGVPPATIRDWLRDAGVQSASLSPEQEVKRLKAEVARLREERDILKKAAAWFDKGAVGKRKKGC